MIDTIIWWTGAGVLAAGGLVGAAALIAGVSIVAVAIAVHYAKRLFVNLPESVRLMWAWDAAGRPEWKFGEDNVARMTPTKPIDDDRKVPAQ